MFAINHLSVVLGNGLMFEALAMGCWLVLMGGWVLVAAVVIGLDLLVSRNEPIRPATRGVALAAAVIAFDIVVSFAIGATLVGFAGLAVAGTMALGLWIARRPLEVTA